MTIDRDELRRESTIAGAYSGYLPVRGELAVSSLANAVPALLDELAAAEAVAARLRNGIVDALPYVPDHIPRTTLLVALERGAP